MLQIRLDFDTFTITGPSTSTASVTRYYDSDKQLSNVILSFSALCGPFTGGEQRRERSFMRSACTENTESFQMREPNNFKQNTGTVLLANAGQCLIDTFSVGNPSGPSPPIICGANTGQHSECRKPKCMFELKFL